MLLFDGSMVPMLCGSAFKNKGVQRSLDAVVDFLPSPLDIDLLKDLIQMKKKYLLI